MDKLISIESRMEDNFSQVHSQMSELRCEFKEQIDGVKVNIKEIEKIPRARVGSDRRRPAGGENE